MLRRRLTPIAGRVRTSFTFTSRGDLGRRISSTSPRRSLTRSTASPLRGLRIDGLRTPSRTDALRAGLLIRAPTSVIAARSLPRFSERSRRTLTGAPFEVAAWAKAALTIRS
jgi:hypothetical protein